MKNVTVSVFAFLLTGCVDLTEQTGIRVMSYDNFEIVDLSTNLERYRQNAATAFGVEENTVNYIYNVGLIIFEHKTQSQWLHGGITTVSPMVIDIVMNEHWEYYLCHELSHVLQYLNDNEIDPMHKNTEWWKKVENFCR